MIGTARFQEPRKSAAVVEIEERIQLRLGDVACSKLLLAKFVVAGFFSPRLQITVLY